MRRVLFCFILLLLLTSYVFASGQQGASVPNESGNPNSTKTLVFIPKATSSQFWVAIWDGAKKAAEELGYKEVRFLGVSSAADVTGQINIFSDVVTSRPDGILVAVNDQKSLKKPIEDALSSGVPIITVNSGVDSDAVLAHVATDNYQAGVLAADTLAKLIGGKGLVIDIGIDAASETGRLRENGFRDRITKAYPDIKVLPVQYANGDVAKAMNVASDLLTGNPEVVGIYSAQDAGGTGAAQVLKQQDIKRKVKLVSFDSSPDEFKLFLDGYIDALIVQDPFMQGYQGVYALDDVINNKITEKQFFETPAKAITLANMRDKDIYTLLARNSAIKKMLKEKGISSK